MLDNSGYIAHHKLLIFNRFSAATSTKGSAAGTFLTVNRSGKGSTQKSPRVHWTYDL